MSRVVGLKKALVGCAVLFALTAGAALAADPTDTTFGTDGIAEIEARFTPPEDLEQVGGIADLEPTRGGKMLAAVYPIASGGQYFAAARFSSDGSPDRSFGKSGITRPEPSRLSRRPRKEDVPSSGEENLRECQHRRSTPTS